MLIQRIYKILNVSLGHCQFHVKLPKRMNKAVVCHFPGENKLTLSFHYDDPKTSISRQFNFERLLEEPISSCVARITSNVQNSVNKKLKKKLKELAVSEDLTIKVEFIGSDGVLSEEKKLSTILDSGGLRLYVEPHTYNVDVNPPIVKSLVLPSPAMMGLTLYPKKLELKFAFLPSCKFNWYCSANPVKNTSVDVDRLEWEHVASGHFLFLQAQWLDHIIRLECIPVKGSREGVPFYVYSKEPVTAGPGKFPFDSRHEFCHDLSDVSSFRMVCYNILANLYADSDFSRTVLFPTCPHYALSMDYRIQLILKELLGYKADFICMQEVDVGVFQQDLEPVLQLNGYQGVLSQKIHSTNGLVNEGVACFYKASKFRLVEMHTLSLSAELKSRTNLRSLWDEVCSDPNLKEKVEDRSNVLQICVLETIKNPSRRIVIGGTHLYFHPLGDAIRLVQVGVCLHLLQEYYEKQLEGGADVSLILSGDFNSTPDTDVYTLVTQPDALEYISLKQQEPTYCISELPLENGLLLSSACGTPEYTNYTSGFSGCLDYMFYTRDKLEVDQVVPLPSHEEVTQHGALPSVVLPSDHLALVADFSFLNE